VIKKIAIPMTLPRLSNSLIKSNTGLLPDAEQLLNLPEKVLQFGTGVLLRGLPDYFINKANQQGVFNGRVVVVKSTDKGGVDAFADQNNVFTQAIRGVADGQLVEENVLNTAISRTLSAKSQWKEILATAVNPEMQIVISNTTEVGIQLVEDDLTAQPPVSFPGKLTAYLYERFNAFEGSTESGLVIVPTELVPDNGQKLKEIVIEQARRHQLPAAFIEWIQTANRFCSSLVDRIVPGAPAVEIKEQVENLLGYNDELLIMSEAYSLWAIEGDEKVKEVLSFSQVDTGVIIEPNIDVYRELKLRLLNGTHTLCVGLCYLYGLDIVREAMENEKTSQFINDLMQQDLAPAIPYPIALEKAHEFGNQVLDRFRNPAIRHQLIDITVQYTAKMKMRNVPTILQHYKNNTIPQPNVVKGFAAYLLFMKAVETDGKNYYGRRGEEKYPIRCDAAGYFYTQWEQYSANIGEFVKVVLSDESVWGTDLSALPGFAEAVTSTLEEYSSNGVNI
jgi:tagaturonate reductase